MNNSSANNFLLKSVQPAPAQVSAPKRNYQSDEDSNFQKSLNDAQDAARSERQPIEKPIVKKVSAADSRKVSNEVEKKPPVSKQSAEPRKDDKSARTDADSKTVEDEVVQASKNDPLKSKAEHKTGDKKEVESDELVPVPESGVLQQTQTPPTSTPQPVTALAITLGAVPVEGEFSDDESMQGEVSAATLVPASASIEGNNTPDTSAQSPISSGEDVSADVQPNTALALNEAESTSLSQQPVAIPDIAEQDPAVIAATGKAEVTKPVGSLAANSVFSQTETQGADSDANNSAVLLGENSVKASPAATANSVVADADTIKAQALDTNATESKATFEKTLQNLIQPDIRAKDESPQSVASPAAATTSSSNPLDSFIRFSDANTPAARGFVVQTAVPVPVGQPQWSQAVGERVLWLAAQNVSSAEINLNPEHLGPMQVKVSVSQEQTTVSFTSHHAVVREVLDQNLGRLRDMFSEQGLNLVNVDVSDKSFSRQQGDGQHQNGQGPNKQAVVEEEAPVAVSLIKQQRLVDHYA